MKGGCLKRALAAGPTSHGDTCCASATFTSQNGIGSAQAFRATERRPRSGTTAVLHVLGPLSNQLTPVDFIEIDPTRQSAG